MASGARPIVFLTDYGLEDEFVGICRGVIARIAPDARVIDLTHAVPPQDVTRGAVLLADAVPFMPVDAVYLAVVDPGVGTGRRGVAVEAASGNVLVGPDNGLLSLAIERLGGAVRAVEVRSPAVLLTPVSATFHGRDVFAPAAAHVAAGTPLRELGPELDPADLVPLSLPRPKVRPGRVAGEVLSVDRFGNVELNVREEDLAAAGLVPGARLQVVGPRAATTVTRVTTFGDVPLGEYALIVDSRGWAAVVRNGASAAEGLGLGPEARVVLEAVPHGPGGDGGPGAAGASR
jgi:S-adenosylmethionine hydrolase